MSPARPFPKSLLCFAALISFCLMSTAQSLAAPTWTDITFPGADITVAYGINNQGDIVGGYAISINDLHHGFLLRAGVYTTVDFPGSTQTDISAINDNGAMVGTYFDTSFNYHGFLYDGVNFTTIDYPGFVGANVTTGINAAGEIVGAFADNQGRAHGFTYANGVYTAIDPPRSNFTIPSAIDSVGNIAGYFTNENTQYYDKGFVLTPNSSWLYVVFPGAKSTETRGLNDKHQMVGLAGDGFGNVAAFIHRGSQFQIIAYPGATRTDAWGINNTGMVVGSYENSANTSHGFLRTP